MDSVKYRSTHVTGGDNLVSLANAQTEQAQMQCRRSCIGCNRTGSAVKFGKCSLELTHYWTVTDHRGFGNIAGCCLYIVAEVGATVWNQYLRC
jgi:hypothetical protein